MASGGFQQSESSNAAAPARSATVAPGLCARIASYARQHGPRAVLAAVGRNVLLPFIRFNRHFIWDVSLHSDRAPSPWSEEEEFSILGPEALDAAITPQLLEFLGGPHAEYDLQGVRSGDRLLLVKVCGDYVYSGYIYFNTTAETRRQKRIYAERDDTPIIGTCVSRPAKVWSEAVGEFGAGTPFRSWLESQLPQKTDLEAAAAGFKSVGQFIYTLRLARNLELPFLELKARVILGKPLWKALAELRPDVDAMAEVRKVWDEASIHRRVLNDVFRYLRKTGCKRAMNEVLAHNQASHQANIAVGMKIRRELRDWTVCRRLVVQHVIEDQRSRWRVFAV